MSLLDAINVRVAYGQGRHAVEVVRGVSLHIHQGETVGLVGESGCGKTSLASALMRLAPVAGGQVRFAGERTDQLSGSRLRAFRRDVQMVFQDPFGSLNPRLTVGAAVAEVLTFHRIVDRRRDATAETMRLLDAVGLDGSFRFRYPHELSGGQRQRVGLARALAVRPRLIIADEPVSALDVSVQVQILNLMRSLQRKLGVAFLLVAHDLAVVRYMSRRVMVMYHGTIVEEGEAAEVYESPSHPYTKALLAAVPDIDRGLARRGGHGAVLEGDPPPAAMRIAGCPFHPRCARASETCLRQAPPRVPLTPSHSSCCHLAVPPPALPQSASGDAPRGTAPAPAE